MIIVVFYGVHNRLSQGTRQPVYGLVQVAFIIKVKNTKQKRQTGRLHMAPKALRDMTGRILTARNTRLSVAMLDTGLIAGL